jgi:hypothetical protein
MNNHVFNNGYSAYNVLGRSYHGSMHLLDSHLSWRQRMYSLLPQNRKAFLYFYNTLFHLTLFCSTIGIGYFGTSIMSTWMKDDPANHFFLFKISMFLSI